MKEFMYIRDTESWREKLIVGVYEEIWFGLLEKTKIARTERGSLQQEGLWEHTGSRIHCS